MTTVDDTTHFTSDKLLEAKANAYAQYLGALAWTIRVDGVGGLAESRAMHVFLERHPRSLYKDLFVKAAMDPMTTTAVSSAAPLVGLRQLSEGFIEFSRPSSLLGKLLAAGARRVPFATSIPINQGGGSFGWVGESAPKPAGQLAFTSASLDERKASGILVISEELAHVAVPPASSRCVTTWHAN
jgi:hypothetical protein